MQRVLRSIRSTPLRLTAILVTIFILSSVVSFATAYFVIRATFDSTLEDEINQRVATYQAIDDQNDLIERLKDDAETSKPELLILQYLHDQGSPISNVRHFPPLAAGPSSQSVQLTIEGGRLPRAISLVACGSGVVS